MQSLRISDFTEAGLRISQDIFLWIITAIMKLYLGYVTHMLADEIFILTVRDRHVEAFRREQAVPDYKEYFTMFGHDVDLNDWRL